MGNFSYPEKNRPVKTPAKRSSSVERLKRTAGNATASARMSLQKGIMKVDYSRKANRYFILFFFVCTFILYGNTLFIKRSADDSSVKGPQNEWVKKGFTSIPAIFSSFYEDNRESTGSRQTDYQPVVKSTYAIEYGLWGGNRPGLGHLINILLYFWITALLFFILKRILKNYNILFPFLITLLFIAHPVHTEVVASLKNREELLSFLCGLGGIHFILRYSEKEKIIYVFAALIVFTLGYLSKSSILPFIMLFPLVLYFFTDMKPGKIIRIFAVFLVVGLMIRYLPGLFLPKVIHENSFIENPLFMEKSIWIRTGTGLMSLLFYLRILVFPHPLLHYYGYNMIPVTGWGNLQVMVSFVIHLGLFVYAVRKLREKHILSFAILYYFIAIAAYSNVVTPVAGIVGERFLFNASLGFVIASVYLIFRIFRTEPRSLTIEFNERAKIVVIFFLLLIPLTVMTIQRNSEWHSLGELYESDIKYLEKSVRANVQYAEFRMGEIYRDPEYRLNGTVYEPVQQVIISHFLTALKLYPDDYTTLNDLGEAYTNLSSKVDSGIVFLKKATALRPELQPAWMNMAMAYHKQNKLDSAISCYERVLKINPGALTAVLKMADLYNEKGEFGRAVKMNEAVMKSYPNLDIPYFNIGYYFILLGDTATGIRYWEQAAQRNASYEVCINLGMIYRAAGDRVKARYFFRLAEEARQRGNTENNP